jgi:uncharacterized membrane protein YphA (DoxX/SURF4 family)
MAGTNGTCKDYQPQAPAGSAVLPSRFCAALGVSCRYVLAAIFLMAAVTKITDLHRFEDQVLLHTSLPSWLGTGVVILLPWVELTCGLCLALGYAVREAALLLSLVLLPLFCYSLVHIDEGDCRCYIFPDLLPAPGWWPPIRDLFLLLCSLCLAFPFAGVFVLLRPVRRFGNAAAPSAPPERLAR